MCGKWSPTQQYGEVQGLLQFCARFQILAFKHSLYQMAKCNIHEQEVMGDCVTKVPSLRDNFLNIGTGLGFPQSHVDLYFGMQYCIARTGQ